jgi:hypothetical protein
MGWINKLERWSQKRFFRQALLLRKVIDLLHTL